MRTKRGYDVVGTLSPLLRHVRSSRRGALKTCAPCFLTLAVAAICLYANMIDMYAATVRTFKPRPHGQFAVTLPRLDKVETAQRHAANEQTSLVYVKTHKTASETFSALFRRFGLMRNLSFVLPCRHRNNLGWPDKLDRGMYNPSKVPTLEPRNYHPDKDRAEGHYEILCEHSVFTEDAMVTMMPRDTAFVTSIREPFQRFRSAFEYFNVSSLLAFDGRGSSNDMADFLDRPDHYDRLLKALPSNGSKMCVPIGLSFLRNGMAFDLGFNQGFPNGSEDWSKDKAATDRWLRRLERRFDLVMLVEYFDESLLLLRHLMNWHWKDILYASRNPTSWSSPSSTDINTSPNQTLVNSEMKHRLRMWSGADYALYEKFRGIILEKIHKAGQGFQNELRFFRFVQNQTTTFCDQVVEGDVLTFTPASLDEMSLEVGSKEDYKEEIKVDLYAGFNVTWKDCYLIRNRLMNEIHQQYDQIPVKVKARKATGQDC